jgi:flagellar biosynthesis protein FlhF
MRLKTYFVESVEEAMLRALGEFGDEAMLVHSKRTSPETRHLGNYEVVFASPLNTTPPASPSAPPPPFPETALQEPPARKRPERATVSMPRIEPSSTATAQDSGKIRRELRALSRMMEAPPTEEISRSEEIRSVLDQLYGFLAEREVQSKHIWDLTKQVGIELMRGAANFDPARPSILLSQLLVRGLAPSPAPIKDHLQVVALVGPPGAGKTATIAKLAVREGLAKGRPLQILDLDDQRIGGGDQLQTICALLGVPYQRLNGPEALVEVLGRARTPGLVLIDTPGLSRQDSAELAVLGLGLGASATIERHLVLPCTLRFAELTRFWNTFRVCQPTHLLLTRADESLCFGPALRRAPKSTRLCSPKLTHVVCRETSARLRRDE